MNHRMTSSMLAARAGLMVALAILAPGWSGWQLAYADATAISTVPVFTSVIPAQTVKPNVMMVLDDSGSMSWGYMPDDAGNFSGRYGYVSAQCNGMYYNPAITYVPPVDASGNSFSNSSFTNAANDGFGLTTGSVNLSTSFQAYNNDTAQPAYYYTYSGLQTTQKLKDYYTTTSPFYRECNSAFGSTSIFDGTHPVNTLFTKVIVGTTSGPGATNETTNFANWYTYYRTRMQMMKTATGLAFKQLNDQFRVGFMTINNNASPAFLNISDFNPAQKSTFYTKLYASNPGNSTPLREALANVGRMYAGKVTTLNNTSVTDPVQYSCQQNYTILSTDGFWNGTDSAVKKIDGTTTMDNQDGGLPRPYNDGSQITTTIVTPYTTTEDRQTVTNINTVTNTWSRTTTTIGAACNNAPIPPSNTTSAPTDVNGGTRVAALGYATSNPSGNQSSACYSLGGNAWFCRGGNNNGAPAVNANSVTSSTGITWYLVSNVSGASGCINARTAFGGTNNNGNYSNNVAACPATLGAGKLVTVTPSTQTETITGFSQTQVDRYVATQTTTQIINNGVAGPIGSLTPTTPVFNFSSNLSTSASTFSSDTSGAWVNGTPNPNAVCTATASLPVSGTSTPVLSGTVNSGRTTTVTVVASSSSTGTPSSTSVGANGVANTLADTAAYYYYTNLRTPALGNCTGPVIPPNVLPNDLCAANRVPPHGIDTATWQHMTTFTLGLGTRGRMIFSPTYLTDTSGDYYDVLKGNTATATNCTWRDTLTVAGGPCNWPVPGSNQIENVDDLWHAAVNGHGNYFSATDPAQLANGLNSSLNQIVNTPRPGAAASATTTNPMITSTNAFQFSSFFETVTWTGELIRQTIDLTTQTVPVFNPTNPVAGTYDWSAQALLDAKSYTTRNIYTAGPTGLMAFNWTNLVAAGLQANFTAPNISTTPPTLPVRMTGLSQFCGSGNCLTSAAQTNTTVATGGAAGEALVKFLLGDRSNEEGAVTDNTKFYRHRTHVLGDIVSAQPQYVGAPDKSYADAGYASFATANKARSAVVYAAANDGMLHAFDATTGNEMWAYIPSFVLPRLYKLADKNYANSHQYFVEGTPFVGDVCPKAPAASCAPADWKTILVGGLSGGGTGYYALDITNPTSPVLLWEFTDANMGFTFGKPQITKMDDGTWVVLLTSGYDNCPFAATAAQQYCAKNGTGDGQGRLYVLNASTGALIAVVSPNANPIADGAGSATTPSGLAQIVAQAGIDNVTTRVYGGDLAGNLWRFTIGSTGFNAHLMARFTDALGNSQPVMEAPQVTTINGITVVYVGTGRYLSASDVGSTAQQSFYAIKDNLATNVLPGNMRTDSSFFSLSAVTGTCPPGTNVSICNPGDAVRFVQSNGVSVSSLKDATKNGWYLDFPAGAGEISFTEPKLVGGTVAFTTSIPQVTTAQVCQGNVNPSEGLSFLYQVDFLLGTAVGTNTGVIGSTLGAGIATSPQIEQFPDGTTKVSVRLSGGETLTPPLRFNPPSSGIKRVSWRELIN